ncbi:Choline dehydrogenase, mitochondrial [Mycena venus]|uniref:Choline dehydrogenase, mitochondrial n=1 Tax=Mycena venus TaxID=2733690 RepID=A0A8H7D8M2_9AGAR|nr:Choline dehydrogenase, mitochondrial [Mycena venus]
MAWFLPIVIFALSATLCSGVILDNIADLNKLNLKWDFIIVGGGNAGNVVANRLSENPAHNVLVLEAGGSNADVLDIIVPFFCVQATPNTAQDWNYTTTPQVGLNNRSMPYNRGFVLGGSSSVNYMVYTRGSKEDFNRWADITGDDGWSWDSLVPYMRKTTTTPLGSSTLLSTDLTASTPCLSPDFPSPIDSLVIETTTQLEGYPFNLDMNSGFPLGIGWAQATVKDGARSSSATSYLAPEFIARPNLYVLLHARVTRVLETTDIHGQKFTLTAEKEVILSAGSVGTPNILMHSGIGNSSTLAKLGITPVHNLPSVGQNLSDHSIVFLSFLVNSNNTFEAAERNATLAAQQFTEWNTSRTGPLVDIPGSHVGWLRVPDNSSIFEEFPDPAAGPNTPHFELIISNGKVGPPPPTGNFMSVIPVVVSPASRGSVTLDSNDPIADPLINPNLVGTEVDLVIMREAVKSAIRFTTAPAWKDYVISPFGLNDTTDAGIDVFIRENAQTIYHPVGTASMSPRGASWGVVDPDLTVKGLSGLRIADLSIVVRRLFEALPFTC